MSGIRSVGLLGLLACAFLVVACEKESSTPTEGASESGEPGVLTPPSNTEGDNSGAGGTGEGDTGAGGGGS
jgi:hypothetical protein